LELLVVAVLAADFAAEIAADRELSVKEITEVEDMQARS